MKIRGRLGQSLLIVLSLVVALTTLLMVGCSSKQATTGQQTMVKLGLSLALTGPMASGSAPMSQGMLAYTKYVNDQGGIQYVDPATGKTEKALLDVHWQDNAYDAAQRLSVYKTQKDWGMVLQLLVSSPDDVAGVASTSAVPIMSVASIDATSLAPQPVYVTGLFVPYPAQNAAFIKWASQQQATPPRIALLALDQPIFRNQFSGKGLTPEFVSQYGGVLADVEYVSPTSTDYTIELTRIKAANPDWIITQLVPSEIALAVTDALRIGMPNTVKFVGTSSTYDESIV
ncbi:MAG TPA: ABC transporter substrate-binding protein, partial [Dehalococcoidia bacterium]|nr:ABC transporter substrate-binding protein [Dehalococcoidia bacterium]